VSRGEKSAKFLTSWPRFPFFTPMSVVDFTIFLCLCICNYSHLYLLNSSGRIVTEFDSVCNATAGVGRLFLGGGPGKRAIA
jgi:hypothetical protein